MRQKHHFELLHITRQVERKGFVDANAAYCDTILCVCVHCVHGDCHVHVELVSGGICIHFQ